MSVILGGGGGGDGERPLDIAFAHFHRIPCSKFDRAFRNKFGPHIYTLARYHPF